MNALIIGLGSPGNDTVNSMFPHDTNDYNFLNVDGNSCYIQSSIMPSLLLEEIIGSKDRR